jgi:hypothetical protein
MADTIADTTIITGVWRDLYAATSIAVGTAVSVVNKGTNPFYIANKATAPAVPSSGAPIGIPCYPQGIYGSIVSVAAGETGLWAYCQNSGNAYALVQV